MSNEELDPSTSEKKSEKSKWITKASMSQQHGVFKKHTFSKIC